MRRIEVTGMYLVGVSSVREVCPVGVIQRYRESQNLGRSESSFLRCSLSLLPGSTKISLVCQDLSLSHPLLILLSLFFSSRIVFITSIPVKLAFLLFRISFLFVAFVISHRRFTTARQPLSSDHPQFTPSSKMNDPHTPLGKRCLCLR